MVMEGAQNHDTARPVIRLLLHCKLAPPAIHGHSECKTFPVVAGQSERTATCVNPEQ